MTASLQTGEQVLALVAGGYLPADAGQQVLAALARPAGQERARLVRVRVSDLAGGRQKASVTVPVGLFPVGLRLGARLTPAGLGAALPALIEALAAAGGGRLLDWRDATLQERFELLVE